ncbi:hypothetical protein ASPBRDRAFT_667254 [Aspergillus brasiliensis CBS 101740]|uniref:Uncharacterized protein n=1 Tax=Aspergillus brasiliensis (strain CBS 101740 / IMI 381727 / IBT 21946) TaxID=767769 RepID=A0A1L9U2S2_ASPBC|nr:hypothetical protein ASPBRDRAFT_667254 [Aspergillus brasiliensis CBS 101740]
MTTMKNVLALRAPYYSRQIPVASQSELRIQFKAKFNFKVNTSLIATQRVETIAGIFLDLVDLSEIMFMDDPAYIEFCCRPAVATGNERLDIHSSKQGEIGYEFADSGVGWDGLV